MLARYYLRIFENIISHSGELSDTQQVLFFDFPALGNVNAWRVEIINTLICILMFDRDLKLGIEKDEDIPQTEDDIKKYQDRAEKRSPRTYEARYNYYRNELQECFFYVMHKHQDLKVIRQQMHELKTIILKLRDESVGLIRIYTGDESTIDDFCKKIENSRDLIEKEGLAAAYYFL